MSFDSPHFMRPYYYGAKKWDDYLIDVRQSVSQGLHAQTEAITGALEDFSRKLETGLEGMRADFNWGMMLIIDRLEEQTTLIRRLTQQLDAIQKTLESPLLTQARELFELGQDRLNKGLLDKALEAFLKAEEKNDVDFLLQLQLGKLYLYGRDEDDNVIDLKQAEQHLLLAARYARAHERYLRDWSRFCGEAYFHSAVAAYLQGNNERTANRNEAVEACLHRAMEHASRAIDVWPKFLESWYLSAKVLCLLGNDRQSVEALKNVVDRDRRYIQKAYQDLDFRSIQAEVAGLSEEVRREPGPTVRETLRYLEAAKQALLLAKKTQPEGGNLSKLSVLEQEVAVATTAIGKMDVDIEALLEWVKRTRFALLTLAKTVVSGRLNELEESNRVDESTIQRIGGNKKESTGTGLGCLLTLLVFPGLPLFAALLEEMNLIPKSRALADTIVVTCVGAAPVAFLVGKLGSILIRNARLNSEIRDLRSRIAERNALIPKWKEFAGQMPEPVLELPHRTDARQT